MYFYFSVFVTLTHATTKYPWEKVNDPQNNHKKKFMSHKITTRKKMVPQNTHEKNLEPMKHPLEKLGPTKYTEGKVLDPWNTHECTMSRWH